MHSSINIYLTVLFALILFHVNGQKESKTERASEEITVLTSENFNDFINQDLVIVDFWASWCHPCRLQSPILDEVKKEVGKKVKIGKVNVDQNRTLSSLYGIQSIPTLLVISKGTTLERLTGLQQKEVLLGIINKYTSNEKKKNSD